MLGFAAARSRVARLKGPAIAARRDRVSALAIVVGMILDQASAVRSQRDPVTVVRTSWPCEGMVKWPELYKIE